MGGQSSSQQRPAGTSSPSRRGRKRQRAEVATTSSEDEKERIEEENLNTPKKKKMKSTSRYIYETLFINGESSDVTIVALGKQWKLHKVYLCQSNYFASMFNGSWKESNEDLIHMEIPDENIDDEALKISFGSLYQDDLLISPTKVIPVLAAATLLSLDGLIQQCADVMKETTSSKTVCSYLTAATMYGQQDVADGSMSWLERNLMSSVTPQLLKDISINLMAEFVKSPDLFVMQVEMDVYSLLKKWLFLQLNSHFTGSTADLLEASEAFWKNKAISNNSEFLHTSNGSRFTKVFTPLRIQHVISDLASAKILEDDRILPMSWLLPVYRHQWLQMIKVEQGHDKGPQSVEDVNFSEVALRCGRVLHKDGEYCWRWTGYNYSLDLLVSVTSRLIIFKRNTHSQQCPGGVYLQGNRNLIYKLAVASLDTLGNPRYLHKSDVQTLSLAKDEESVILALDRKVQFPLHISCQFLVYTPRKNYSQMTLVRRVNPMTLQGQSKTMPAENVTQNNEDSVSVHSSSNPVKTGLELDLGGGDAVT